MLASVLSVATCRTLDHNHMPRMGFQTARAAQREVGTKMQPNPAAYPLKSALRDQRIANRIRDMGAGFGLIQQDNREVFCE